MFSQRTSWDRRPSKLSLLLERQRRGGEPLLDLTSSNPTACGLAWDGTELCRLLSRAEASLHEPDPRGLRSAREAIAAWLARGSSRPQPERIVITASTSEAYAFLFKLLCEPGDAVIIPRPSYPLFDFLATLDAVETVPYPLRPGEAWGVDVEALADSLPERARAVLLVSPNNPTGTFVGPEQARRLAATCRERRLAVVCDEVFGEFAWDAGESEPGTRSLLRTFEEAGVLCFALSGLSKAAGLPQLKLAWILAGGPGAVRDEALDRLEWIADTYLSVAAPVQWALADILEASAAWRQRALERIAGNREVIRRSLAGSGCHALPAEAGWSQVIALPDDVDEEGLVHDLLAREHVLVQPGYFFDMPGEGHLVVSLLGEPSELQVGLERLRSML